MNETAFGTSRRGLFVTLEGGEGAGKSTALEAVRAVLAREGIAAEFTREPGGTALGEAIRRLVLEPGAAIVPEAELLLVFAARAQHVAERIEPALARGSWVVSDRYTDASYAYQGGGRGQPARRIAALERWAAFGLRPRRTWLLDLPVEVGLARAGARGKTDRMEQESQAFFERVRRAYLERAAGDGARFVRVDASQPLAVVVAAIEHDLGGLIASWREGRA